MAFTARAAARAVTGICALLALAWLAGCDSALGTSPPHAAPADPNAEGGDGQVELSWRPVTDATRYVVLWDNNAGTATYDNEIKNIEGTSYIHTGLTNLQTYHYRIAAETSGGRGPESLAVRATPGPVPGPVEWTAVTTQNPGHTVYFAPAANATHYRVYFAGLESQLVGRRPNAAFERANDSPHVLSGVGVASSVFYRVFAMNGTRIGTGGPVALSPASVISEHDLPIAGAAFGRVNDDDCLDLPTAGGGVDTGICTSSYTARVLADAGLADLIGSPRHVSDARFADFNGDGFDDLFSNTKSQFSNDESFALLHMNQGNGNYQTSASVSALAIRGVGGTLLAADLDNDGDVDLFAPYDQSNGDGARNWLLINNGNGVFHDTAAAAGVANNPAGAAYIPRGGQAVDFDEDGFVDLFFGSRLMLNNGDGTFRDGSAAAHMPQREDNGLKLIDVDLDGDLDLIHHTGTLTRLYRNAGGVFDGGQLVGRASIRTYGNGLAACDINDDGFEDVIVANNRISTNQGTPRILVNVNGELLISATQQGIPSDPDRLVARNEQLACGDQNGDGMMDVLSRWGETYRLMRGAGTLTNRIVLRIVGSGGDRNQQGRIVRVVPKDTPNRIMTRVVDSGSGLRAQNMYDLVVGTPWPGDYRVTVGFADGDVRTTAKSGDKLVIFEDGRVEDIDPDDGG
jgi:FG-GAP-like repeat/Fibronectin type III domain